MVSRLPAQRRHGRLSLLPLWDREHHLKFVETFSFQGMSGNDISLIRILRSRSHRARSLRGRSESGAPDFRGRGSVSRLMQATALGPGSPSFGTTRLASNESRPKRQICCQARTCVRGAIMELPRGGKSASPSTKSALTTNMFACPAGHHQQATILGVLRL